MSTMRAISASASGWALLAGLLGVVLLFAQWQGEPHGWPGTPNGCREEMRPACFCERLREGPVAQPSNTWSNLGFMAAGVAVGVHADRRRRRSRTLLFSSPVYPAVFATAITLLGPGSMALHATMTIWGGRIDVASMYLFIGLVVAWALTRLHSLSGATFALLFAGIFGALVGTKFWLPINSDFVFAGMIGVAVLLNVRLVRTRPDIRLQHRFVFLAAGLFAVAFGIWLPSRSGGLLCFPETWLQGHAVWHVLCAGSAAAVYLYAASEGEPEA